MTTQFKERSAQKELLDGSNIPFADIRQNMAELDVINHYLGGHRITVNGLRRLLQPCPPAATPLLVVEVGCGGGDNLRAIRSWAAQKGLPVDLCGIDISRECIAYAQGQVRNSGIRFLCSDYREAVFIRQPHIIFSSLFCHHFSNREVVDMLQWMQQHTTVGFFINDLHRHPLAYHSIRLLTRLFSKSRLVKNDAPLSVLRSFTKKDWQAIFRQADIPTYTCSWQWAFRWLVTYQHPCRP